MFNITKQGSSLLITSNDNSQFPWKDGQMSLPMNSVVYVIDESDYIAFRSASNNDILFTALIDEIQINGTNVTKDDFILQFDNVANSAGGGGGSASAGVNSINGFQGDLTLKTVNGNSLIGSGDIEISGDKGLTDIFVYDGKLIGMEEDGNWRNEVYFKTINGQSIIGKEGDIVIAGGEPIEETDPIFTEWKKGETIIAGNGATYDTDGAFEEDIHSSIVIGKNASVWADGIAIGENATSESGAVVIGKNVSSYGIVAIGTDNEGSGIAIGKNNKGSGISIGSDNNNGGIAIGNNITENYGGIAIGTNISNSTDNGIAIGWDAKVNTKNPENVDNCEGIAIGLGTIAYDKNDVAIGISVSTDETYTTNINNIIKGDKYNYAYVLNEYGNYVRIPTEWTGTQSQYDALGEYYDNITYNIIEG